MFEQDKFVLAAKSRKGCEKRKSLILAAREIIVHQGLSALTVFEVCDRVGLKRSSFYTHYADLDELLVNLARLTIESVNAKLNALCPRVDSNRFVSTDRLLCYFDLLEADRDTSTLVYQLITSLESVRSDYQKLFFDELEYAVAHNHPGISGENAPSIARMLCSVSMDFLAQIAAGQNLNDDIEFIRRLSKGVYRQA